MFNFLKEKLAKVYTQFTAKVSRLFSLSSVNEQSLNELYALLISADVGVTTTQNILEHLKQSFKKSAISSGSDLQHLLQKELITLLSRHVYAPLSNPRTIYLLVGINGSGKTTCAAKLAYRYKNEGKKVLLVAADTFRAAAVEQLTTWAKRTTTPLNAGRENQDPASVVYEGCERFMKENFDCMIIDTAGRLQTKEPLMKELNKIKRTIERKIPTAQIITLLTLDAMLGQNSLVQAQLFNEVTPLSGIILTKLDGTGKGGIVFAIQETLQVPIAFLSTGEQLEHIQPFNAREYVALFLGASH